LPPKTDSQLKNWIRQVYLKIFEREPDAEGLKFYINKVQNNEIQIDQIPSIFKKTTEFVQLQKNKEKLYKNSVIKSIFVIGVPRSGTTFLYDILCKHQDLTWFTSYDLPDLIPKDQHKTIIENWKKIKFSKKKVPQTEEHFFASMEYRKVTGGPLLKPISIEGEVFFRRFFGSFFTINISLDVKIQLLKEIADFLKAKNKRRFLNKAPQNCMRLFALQKCFPDAKFINIHRDPRAVVSSMIERDVEEGHFDTGIPTKQCAKVGLAIQGGHRINTRIFYWSTKK